jgi:hypothetical protein
MTNSWTIIEIVFPKCISENGSKKIASSFLPMKHYNTERREMPTIFYLKMVSSVATYPK